MTLSGPHRDSRAVGMNLESRESMATRSRQYNRAKGPKLFITLSCARSSLTVAGLVVPVSKKLTIKVSAASRNDLVTTC